MSRSREIILFVCLLAVLLGSVLTCELDQAHQGCKIQVGTCICGFGCKSEYRYNSNRECKKALRERGTNICSRTPCLNKGICIQVTQEPRFKCMCGGTGYYGTQCERPCPVSANGGVFPYECVVI